MKNFFVPTGEIIYLGTDTELADVIYSLNGKMETDRNFRCYVFVPGKRRQRGVSFVIRRGKVSFLFRGKIVLTGENYKLTYKVYPGSSALLFVLPLYALLRVVFDCPDSLGGALAMCGVLCAIVIGAFLLLRRFAIRQFVRIIENEEDNEEDSEGIFD